MKLLNARTALLLLWMTCLSLLAIGQVPSGYTIVATHNDDITWYEVRDSRGYLGAVYNGKIIGHCDSDWTAVSYSHGRFFYEYGGKSLCVYDKQGNQVKKEGYGYNFVDCYEVVNGKLYMIKNGYVYDEHFHEIGDEVSKVGNITYFRIKENYKYGIVDLTNSEEVLAPEFQDCAAMGGNLFKFKMNGYWGVMDRQGKIIIPTSRHYTEIDYSRTLKIFTFEKETEAAYFKGECNASGVQTAIEKTRSKSKPQQQTTKPKQETKPQQPKQETKTTPTPSPTPQPQPQPVRQPQPFQVWQACGVCGGTGQCQSCLGTGHSLYGTDRCWNCGGNGKCTHCAGQGGRNVIEYH